MAIYGLQPEYKDNLLKQYFGISKPDLSEKEMFLGLGLTQQGAQENMEDFNEVFSGKPLGNYMRARVIFGKAQGNEIKNINEIVFTTATEDWTSSKEVVEMLGIFDTMKYVNFETNELIKPIVVLPLKNFLTVEKGETIILSTNSITLSLTDI